MSLLQLVVNADVQGRVRSMRGDSPASSRRVASLSVTISQMSAGWFTNEGTAGSGSYEEKGMVSCSSVRPQVSWARVRRSARARRRATARGGVRVASRPGESSGVPSHRAC
ncbi:hypothetical protein [Streptomyces sp. NL15-2K]|uniref:hypothetical protein n=1 Tax=Streptomyces sp. NL15-2K TaxID=376149 RepID=UPI000F569224|nr:MULTISPECIES: hypothetical protein [Actinomycetes]WKX13866.1 hypothetical protein Q4V64_42615 [Kutzneria buriramensis]GCB52008.1 hypothetical protein SNL152K_9364 [Streptomyces sp. NL15-2K]